MIQQNKTKTYKQSLGTIELYVWEWFWTKKIKQSPGIFIHKNTNFIITQDLNNISKVAGVQ